MIKFMNDAKRGIHKIQKQQLYSGIKGKNRNEL